MNAASPIAPEYPMPTHQNFRPTSIAAILLAVPAITSLLGCTSRSQVFEGYGDDQLWTAMVATARAPSYDDWKIDENEVFVDDAQRRIEIYRVLKRTYVSPYSDPRKEEEEWRFQIVLARDAELDQPMVDFTARQITVPAHVWDEADRYFAQMRLLLGPVKSPAADAPATTEEPTPMPPPLEPEGAGSAAGEAPASAPSAGEPTPEPLPER